MGVDNINGRYNGGSDDVSNLEVLCAPCNLSMLTEDLEEFKARFFGSRHQRQVAINTT